MAEFVHFVYKYICKEFIFWQRKSSSWRSCRCFCPSHYDFYSHCAAMAECQVTILGHRVSCVQPGWWQHLLLHPDHIQVTTCTWRLVVTPALLQQAHNTAVLFWSERPLGLDSNTISFPFALICCHFYAIPRNCREIVQCMGAGNRSKHVWEWMGKPLCLRVLWHHRSAIRGTQPHIFHTWINC